MQIHLLVSYKFFYISLYLVFHVYFLIALSQFHHNWLDGRECCALVHKRTKTEAARTTQASMHFYTHGKQRPLTCSGDRKTWDSMLCTLNMRLLRLLEKICFSSLQIASGIHQILEFLLSLHVHEIRFIPNSYISVGIHWRCAKSLPNEGIRCLWLGFRFFFLWITQHIATNTYIYSYEYISF